MNSKPPKKLPLVLVNVIAASYDHCLQALHVPPFYLFMLINATTDSSCYPINLADQQSEPWKFPDFPEVTQPEGGEPLLKPSQLGPRAPSGSPNFSSKHYAKYEYTNNLSYRYAIIFLKTNHKIPRVLFQDLMMQTLQEDLT